MTVQLGLLWVPPSTGCKVQAYACTGQSKSYDALCGQWQRTYDKLSYVSVILTCHAQAKGQLASGLKCDGCLLGLRHNPKRNLPLLTQVVGCHGGVCIARHPHINVDDVQKPSLMGVLSCIVTSLRLLAKGRCLTRPNQNSLYNVPVLQLGSQLGSQPGLSQASPVCTDDACTFCVNHSRPLIWRHFQPRSALLSAEMSRGLISGCRCWQTGSLWTAARCALRPRPASFPSSPLAGSAGSCAKVTGECQNLAGLLPINV